jgi:hypothetical protein
VFFARLGSHTADSDAQYRGSGFFILVPNDLIFMFADRVEIDYINAVLRTARAMNGLLTQYMYRHTKDRCSRNRRPYFLRTVDTDNLTTVAQFINVATPVNMSEKMDNLFPTALHSCMARANIRIAEILVQTGVNMSPGNESGVTPLHIAALCPDPSEASPGRRGRHLRNLHIYCSQQSCMHIHHSHERDEVGIRWHSGWVRRVRELQLLRHPSGRHRAQF